MQVHIKAFFGASPVTSQLRWTRLDVIGLAPLHVNNMETFSKLHVTNSVHTHTRRIYFIGAGPFWCLPFHNEDANRQKPFTATCKLACVISLNVYLSSYVFGSGAKCRCNPVQHFDHGWSRGCLYFALMVRWALGKILCPMLATWFDKFVCFCVYIFVQSNFGCSLYS